MLLDEDAAVNTDKSIELHPRTSAIAELNKNIESKLEELQNLDFQQERYLAGFTEFLENLADSSATPCLDKFFDPGQLELVGQTGHFGYVFKPSSQRDYLIKAIHPRWVSIAAREWMHGHAVGHHDNIVDYHNVFLHRDVDEDFKSRVLAAFEAGLLGRCPQVFPKCYFCVVLEYMDCGTVQSLLNRGLLQVEGIAEVCRCMAAALSYMHKMKRTHNDLKTENVLLKSTPGSNHLIAKLADLGLAEHSTDRDRDNELFAYMIWCMGLNRKFRKVPALPSERAVCVDDLRKCGSECEDGKGELWEQLAKITEALWNDSFTMFQLRDWPEIQGYKIIQPCSEEDKLFLEGNAKQGALSRKKTTVLEHRVDKLPIFDRPARPSLAFWEGAKDTGIEDEEERPVSPYSRAASACSQRTPTGGGGSSSLMTEAERLQHLLDEKTRDLVRLELQADNEIEGYTEFLKALAETSAANLLDQVLDCSDVEVLGRGNYGYVLSSTRKTSGERVVLKVQSPRWVAVCMQEWMHGSRVGQHVHIVEHELVLMHRDEHSQIARWISDAFDSGSLTGKRPKRFPDTYVCLILEYMDRGTVQSFMDKELLLLEGVAAITRSIASALGYMHSKTLTHNDIKPDNILLKLAQGGQHLIPKLADLGLAQHSSDRAKDCEQFAYTVWCMGLNKRFEKIPQTLERQACVAEFKRNSTADLRRVSTTSGEDEALRDSLSDAIAGVWQGKFEIGQLVDWPQFQGCQIKEPESESAISRLEQDAKLELKRRSLKLGPLEQRAADTASRKAFKDQSTLASLDEGEGGELSEEQSAVKIQQLYRGNRAGTKTSIENMKLPEDEQEAPSPKDEQLTPNRSPSAKEAEVEQEMPTDIAATPAPLASQIRAQTSVETPPLSAAAANAAPDHRLAEEQRKSLVKPCEVDATDERLAVANDLGIEASSQTPPDDMLTSNVDSAIEIDSAQEPWTGDEFSAKASDEKSEYLHASGGDDVQGADCLDHVASQTDNGALADDAANLDTTPLDACGSQMSEAKFTETGEHEFERIEPSTLPVSNSADVLESDGYVGAATTEQMPTSSTLIAETKTDGLQNKEVLQADAVGVPSEFDQVLSADDMRAPSYSDTVQLPDPGIQQDPTTSSAALDACAGGPAVDAHKNDSLPTTDAQMPLGPLAALSLDGGCDDAELKKLELALGPPLFTESLVESSTEELREQYDKILSIYESLCLPAEDLEKGDQLCRPTNGLSSAAGPAGHDLTLLTDRIMGRSPGLDGSDAVPGIGPNMVSEDDSVRLSANALRQKYDELVSKFDDIAVAPQISQSEEACKSTPANDESSVPKDMVAPAQSRPAEQRDFQDSAHSQEVDQSVCPLDETLVPPGFVAPATGGSAGQNDCKDRLRAQECPARIEPSPDPELLQDPVVGEASVDRARIRPGTAPAHVASRSAATEVSNRLLDELRTWSARFGAAASHARSPVDVMPADELRQRYDQIALKLEPFFSSVSEADPIDTALGCSEMSSRRMHRDKAHAAESNPDKPVDDDSRPLTDPSMFLPGRSSRSSSNNSLNFEDLRRRYEEIVVNLEPMFTQDARAGSDSSTGRGRNEQADSLGVETAQNVRSQGNVGSAIRASALPDGPPVLQSRDVSYASKEAFSSGRLKSTSTDQQRSGSASAQKCGLQSEDGSMAPADACGAVVINNDQKVESDPLDKCLPVSGQEADTTCREQAKSPVGLGVRYAAQSTRSGSLASLALAEDVEDELSTSAAEISDLDRLLSSDFSWSSSGQLARMSPQAPPEGRCTADTLQYSPSPWPPTSSRPGTELRSSASPRRMSRPDTVLCYSVTPGPQLAASSPSPFPQLTSPSPFEATMLPWSPSPEELRAAGFKPVPEDRTLPGSPVPMMDSTDFDAEVRRSTSNLHSLLEQPMAEIACPATQVQAIDATMRSMSTSDLRKANQELRSEIEGLQAELERRRTEVDVWSAALAAVSCGHSPRSRLENRA